jgi:hypothetical protein
MTDNNNDDLVSFSSDSDDFQHFLETYVELLKRYEKRSLDLLQQSHQAANEFVAQVQQSPVWCRLQDIIKEQQSNFDALLESDTQKFPERLRRTLMEEWNTHGMPRKRRENLSKEKVKLLKEWFDEHAHHPYPTEDEKEQLCQKTGVPKEQVSTTSLFSERSY